MRCSSGYTLKPGWLSVPGRPWVLVLQPWGIDRRGSWFADLGTAASLRSGLNITRWLDDLRLGPRRNCACGGCAPRMTLPLWFVSADTFLVLELLGPSGLGSPLCICFHRVRRFMSPFVERGRCSSRGHQDTAITVRKEACRFVRTFTLTDVRPWANPRPPWGRSLYNGEMGPDVCSGPSGSNMLRSKRERTEVV